MQNDGLTSRKALVVMLDGLSPAFLGPYGATWVETPAWNELAAEGFLFDFAWTISASLQDIYQGYWQAARYRAGPPGSPLHAAPFHLARCMSEHSVRTVLATDEPSLAESGLAQEFEERHFFDVSANRSAATDCQETAVGQCLAAAWEIVEKLLGQAEPFLFWLHLRALLAEWDAPQALRAQLQDEGDPEPAEYLVPPLGEWPATPDPDTLWTLRAAYAAQVMAVDAALGIFLQTVQQYAGSDDALLLVVGAPRGYALADHCFVGPEPPRLYSDVLHVPLVVRTPDPETRMGRSPLLVEPADVCSALAEWWNPAAQHLSGKGGWCWRIINQQAGETSMPVIAQGKVDRSVRTDNWLLRWESESPQLFVKPSDRYDVNDVARRCPEEAQQLAALLLGESPPDAADLP
ncbi:MAG: hypothetical protein KatS3mg110_0362 [Pirellulaceae bacterium]|nr:MAG: hypothetical protein KatS3mg110_0362 [Pirellulaceae bacterium]